MHPNGIRFGAKIEIERTKSTFQFSRKTKHRNYSFDFRGKRKCQNQSFLIQYPRKSKLKIGLWISEIYNLREKRN